MFQVNDEVVTDWAGKGISDIHYSSVQFNNDVLNEVKTQQIKQFSIPAEEMQPLEVTIERVIHSGNGGWSAIGSINENPLNSFILSFSPESGKVLSSIDVVSDHAFFEIQFDSRIAGHIMVEKNPHQMDELTCGHGDQATIPSEKPKAAKNSVNKSTEPFEDQGRATIDVLIVYTPEALSWANSRSSGIDNIVNQSMATAQLIADNSNLNIEFQLVHSQLIQYQESGSSLTDLRRLTASPEFNPWGSQNANYMDEVHQIRDNYSADLVALFTHTSDVGGIAWVNNNPNGLAKYAFSISRIQQAGGRTHAHEMGHNLGSAHSKDQNSSPADSNDGVFEYSKGWRWTGNDGTEYASAMTYTEGAVGVNIFSNPDISYEGVPTGSYNGEFAPADNARSIRNMQAIIEKYRIPAGNFERPTVVTSTISNISYASAQVSGKVIVDKGTQITERGFCWNVEENPDFSNNCLSEGTGQGSFTSLLTHLEQDTRYYVRAFATTRAGSSFGMQQKFTSRELKEPQSLDPVAVNAVSFVAHWSNIPDAERYFLDVSTDSNFSSFVANYKNINASQGSTFFVDGLAPGTQYYYRVRSSVETTQSDHSNVQQVATTDISRTNSKFDLSKNKVLATGAQQSLITVSIKDSQNKPVEGINVLLRQEQGSSIVSPNQVSTDKSGVAMFSISNTIEETAQYNIVADGLNVSSTEIEFLFSEGQLTLGNNYPNPYNNQTRIPIVIPQRTRVRLDLYNTAGARVQSILDEEFNVGYYEIPFNASGLSSGVYFYRMVTDQGVRIEKMILAK